MIGAAAWASAQTTAPTATPAAAEPPAEVAGWLRDLGSDAFADRERAQQRLVEIGEPARPAVAALAATAEDPEVRGRAAAVLRQLDVGVHLSATRITLHLRDVPTRELLDRLAEQAGTEFAYGPDKIWERPERNDHGAVTGPRPTASIDLEGVPFWQAVQQVADVTGFHPGVMSRDDDRPIMYFHAPPVTAIPVLPDQPGLAQQHGPFVVRVDSAHFTVSRDQTYALPKAVRRENGPGGAVRQLPRLTLSLRVFAEPKIRPARDASLRGRVDEAVTETGRSLLKDGPSGLAHIIMHGWIGQTAISLDAEAADGSKFIRLLRGVIPVSMVTEAQPIEIDDLPAAVGKRRTFGPVVVTVDAVDAKDPDGPAGDGNHALRLTFFVSNARTHEALGTLYDELNVYDEGGRRLETKSLWHAPADEAGLRRRVTVHLHAPQGTGPPSRLTATIPTATTVYDVPFEFRDLPLP